MILCSPTDSQSSTVVVVIRNSRVAVVAVVVDATKRIKVQLKQIASSYQYNERLTVGCMGVGKEGGGGNGSVSD